MSSDDEHRLSGSSELRRQLDIAAAEVEAAYLQITFEIPNPWWVSSNGRLGWRAKAERTRYLRQFAAATARNQQLPKNLRTPVRVLAEITYPRSGDVDPNNAEPTTKALLDGLTDHGCWPDDNRRHVIGPDHRYGGVTPGKRTVTFIIAAVEEPQ